jgi:tetratricopeptide (TPR) repeat protein
MNRIITNLRTASFHPRLGARLVFFITLAAYVLTTAPTIGPIDSGELSLAVNTLGIAHPTGYPLFTLLGKIWVTLMFWGDLAFRLNIFSALVGACSAALLFLTLMKLEVRPLLSIAGSFLWAFSPVVWDQATVMEVYGLTSLLGMLLIWLSLRYRKENDFKILALTAFTAGLGMGNHLSLLWYLPGVLIIVFDKSIVTSWRKILLLVCLFLLGLSVYLYLPLRSLNDPLFNWGDPSNWPRFLGHVTGRQYRVWMFNNSLTELWHNVIRFLKIALVHPWEYFSWLAVPGFVWLFLKNKRWLAALAAIILASVLYGINYSIPDIAAYFLPALAALSISAALGLQTLSQLASARFGLQASKAFCWAALALSLAVPAANWRQADRSRDHFTVEFANDILVSAGPNAVILTDNWDIYAPCLYLINQQGLRSDLVLIDKELLRRSWYYRYLEKQYPVFYGSCRAEIEAFLPQLELFEQGRAYDPAKIQSRYVDLLKAMVLRNYYDRPAYLTRADLGADYRSLAQNYELVPEGLLYRIALPGVVANFLTDSMFCQKTKAGDTLGLSDRERLLYKTYPKMFYHRGFYLSKYMQYSEALPYFIKALGYDDRHPMIYIGLGGTYAGLNRVEEAITAFQKALELDPANQIAMENIDRLRMFTPGGPKSYRMEIKE